MPPADRAAVRQAARNLWQKREGRVQDVNAPWGDDRRVWPAVVVLAAAGLLAGGLAVRRPVLNARDRWRAETLFARTVVGGVPRLPLAAADFEEALLLAESADPPARHMALSAAVSGPRDEERLRRVDTLALGCLDSPDPAAQASGLSVLWTARRAAHRGRAAALLDSPDPQVRQTAASAVRKFDEMLAEWVRTDAFGRPPTAVELDRLAALCVCGEPFAESVGIDALGEAAARWPEVRPAATAVLARMAADPAGGQRRWSAKSALDRLEATVRFVGPPVPRDDR